MWQSLGSVTLRTGEAVAAGVIVAPDQVWRERILQLLAHKEDLWNWQTAELISQPTGVDARFYVLQREGAPLCHIMTATVGGVGLLGHVWTEPADRGQSAASLLMQLQMTDFHERGGQALFLGTGFNTSPFRIYQKHGFSGVEADSGLMSYYRDGEEKFEEQWFSSGEVELAPLNWAHWSLAAPLFASDFPEVVRCAPLRLLGRSLTEGPLLPWVRAEITRRDQHETPQVAVLQKAQNSAVCGLAAWEFDPLWPEVCTADVFCHPNFWQHGEELLNALQLPANQRVMVYADAGENAKARVLRVAGFAPLSVLPRWIAADKRKSAWRDVALWEKA